MLVLIKMLIQNYNNAAGRDKRKKMCYKPYWNENLSAQWKTVCKSEKKWLRFTGPNCTKRKLKEEYCVERKTFDRLNRKFKRQFH